MPKRRYRICETQEPVLTVDIEADLFEGGVYLLVADEYYKRTDSRIVYIGMTTGGAKRIAESAAKHITGALDNDILKLEAFAVYANREPNERQSLPALLESALLARHKARFGSLPLLNKRGGVSIDVDSYFTVTALDRILDRHSGCEKGFCVEEASD